MSLTLFFPFFWIVSLTDSDWFRLEIGFISFPISEKRSIRLWREKDLQNCLIPELSMMMAIGYWLIIIHIYFLFICMIQRGCHRYTDDWLTYFCFGEFLSFFFLLNLSCFSFNFIIKIWNIVFLWLWFTYYYYHSYNFAFNFYFIWNVHSKIASKGTGIDRC